MSVLTAVVSLAVGVILGLSLAAPPGPMNAVIAEESVSRGWSSGFAAGLGAMTADVCFFVLAFAGVVAFIEDAPTVRTVMIGVGGVLMLYYAYGALRDAQSFTSFESADGQGFRKAFALALTNPFQVTWWLTVGVGLLNPGTISVLGLSLSAGNGALTLIGFFAGIILWITTFPATLRVAGDRVDALGTGVAYASAVILALFGLVFLRTAIGM